MNQTNRSEPMATPLEHIDDPTLPARVTTLSPAELDSLPFGVIRLDADGKVTFYSKTEAELSGYGDRRAIGRDFFTQMAPCLATPERLRRIDQARLHALDGRHVKLDQGLFLGQLCLVLFADADNLAQDLDVRVVSARGGGLWLFLERP